jgi:Fe-S oxidoreductase
MQPEISKKLKERKVQTLEELKPDVISAGNIGCMMQIGSSIGVPSGSHCRIIRLGYRGDQSHLRYHN